MPNEDVALLVLIVPSDEQREKTHGLFWFVLA